MAQPPPEETPPADPHAGKPCTGLENGCPVCLKLSERRSAPPSSSEGFPVAARRLLEWIVATQALGTVTRDRCLEVLSRWRFRDELDASGVNAQKLDAIDAMLDTIATELRTLAGFAKLRDTHAARADEYRALLERVRCYAIVDPLGNPAALATLAERMHGIETDIDEALRR